jgi:sterol desaturase/sphingolipid hydroxylase (fatty acid hydroxylase superfamily)
MYSIWIIAGVIFLVSTQIVVMLTLKKSRMEYKDRMWKLWGIRTWYWQGVIIISSALTVLILMLLKWGNILDF